VGGALVLALLAWLAVASLPDGKLHVTFFGLEDGDAAWVETPGGRQVLVGGGPAPSALLAHVGRRMPFWDRGIDLVVLTALDRDHLAGVIPILERYQVDAALVTSPLCRGTSRARWRELIRGGRVTVHQASVGTVIDLGRGERWTVVYPDSASGEADPVPMVLRLDYGEACFQFAASAGSEDLRAMLTQERDIRCSIVQAGRWGAGDSTSFLQAARPALIVLPCDGGRESSARAAQIESIVPGAAVFETCGQGSVELISDGASYEIRARPGLSQRVDLTNHYG
jgi:competence protein ComEC